MRSRNGNRPFTLAVCSLILIPFLRADEYIISYRAVTENALLIREDLTVSHAMRACTGTPQSPIFLDTDNQKNLKRIIDAQYEDFFDYISRQGLHVEHYSENRNHINLSRTTITLPPRCFTVDFNEDFVRISALK